jgi:pimeloyl-ACP methyl ester carboxylesterase
MLHLQKHHLTQVPLFRFMILMGGNLPYSADYDEGLDVTDWIAFHRMPLLASADLDEIRAFNEWAPDNQDKRPDPMDKTGISPILHKIMDQHVSGEFDRRKFDSRLLHPEVTKLRVTVPTLHVLGSQDDAYKGAQNMLQLCDPKYRLQYTFEGGHEIPRAKTDLVKIKEMIEKTVQTSVMLS